MFDAKSKAWTDFKAKIDEFVEQGYNDAIEKNPKFKKQITKFYPYKMETDADGEETGRVMVTIKQNSFFTTKDGEKVDVSVGVMDAKGKPIPPSIPVYSGSTVKVSFSVRPNWIATDKKAGTKLDLNGIQVIQLVTANGTRSMESYGFSEEEGYEQDEEATTSSSTDDNEAEGETEDADANDPTSF